MEVVGFFVVTGQRRRRKVALWGCLLEVGSSGGAQVAVAVSGPGGGKEKERGRVRE